MPARSQPPAHWYQRVTPTHWALGCTAILALFIFTLHAMGQIPICECGYIKLWHGIVQSSENSQHVADWYTPSHVIHGFGFYLLLWLVGRRWPIGMRIFLALLLETGWEVFENTDLVINRYRSATISLDYYGDSILNSFSDVLAALLGFIIAWRAPIALTIAGALLMEIIVGYAIRDNLLLNIIMLIYPFPGILEWQAGPALGI